MHEMQLFRDHRLIKGGLNLMQELLAKGEENATVTLSILATIPILLLTLFYSLIFGKKKKSAPVVSHPQSPFIYKILLGVQCSASWIGVLHKLSWVTSAFDTATFAA
jgi:hypothetical protein